MAKYEYDTEAQLMSAADVIRTSIYARLAQMPVEDYRAASQLPEHE